MPTERETALSGSALQAAILQAGLGGHTHDTIRSNMLLERTNNVISSFTARIPPDLMVDLDNCLGAPSTSSVAAVNGEYAIPAAGSVRFTLGGAGYRPGILHDLVIDSADANFARLSVKLYAPSNGKTVQVGSGTCPARVFAPFALTRTQMHIGLNANVTMDVEVFNPTAAVVNICFTGLMK